MFTSASQNWAVNYILYAQTVQNLLSTAQQLYINYLRRKKDSQSGQTPVYVKGGAKPGAKALEKANSPRGK